ncbi:hypothetical protein [Nitrosomonas aestuarii]|uniref:hypothetical protein n=1 Tax=Nitrosomonas aestuarii TaxID=52441 RepID=UPI001BAACF92|nr:hypothetical protein [Nitrosomonas aestuarii]
MLQATKEPFSLPRKRPDTTATTNRRTTNCNKTITDNPFRNLRLGQGSRVP